MTERRHNKMYREIEGYEDALYTSYEIKDELDEVKDKLRYGYSKEEVLASIDKVQRYVQVLRAAVSNGGYETEE